MVWFRSLVSIIDQLCLGNDEFENSNRANCLAFCCHQLFKLGVCTLNAAKNSWPLYLMGKVELIELISQMPSIFLELKMLNSFQNNILAFPSFLFITGFLFLGWETYHISLQEKKKKKNCRFFLFPLETKIVETGSKLEEETNAL